MSAACCICLRRVAYVCGGLKTPCLQHRERLAGDGNDLSALPVGTSPQLKRRTRLVVTLA